MKRPIAAIAIALAAIVGLAAAELTKTQKIEQILDLTQGGLMVDRAVKQVREVLEQAQPNPTSRQLSKRDDALKKIAKLVRDRLDKVRPELVRIYNDSFTESEIDGLLAFYNSPAGRAAILKLPAVNDRISGMIQTQIDTLSIEINKLAEDTLKN